MKQNVEAVCINELIFHLSEKHDAARVSTKIYNAVLNKVTHFHRE